MHIRFFLLLTLLLTALIHGCAGKTVEQKTTGKDFILLNPFKDDPDNPSPHNPLIKKFGDTREVRTYIRLNGKYLSGVFLTIDEAINLYTAEFSLYSSEDTKRIIENLKHHRYILAASDRLHEPIYSYTGRFVTDFSHSEGLIHTTRILPNGRRIHSVIK